MIKNNNLFSGLPVEWNILAARGIELFANGALFESEAVMMPGTKLKILQIYEKGGKFIINAEVGG